MLVKAEEALEVRNLRTEDRKKAEYYLLNFETELRRYEDALHEYMNYHEEHDENVGGGKGNIVSDPTERQALKKIEFDRQRSEYSWLKAVEIVQRGLGERKNIFIRVRREAERNNLYTLGRGRKGWVLFVQRRYTEEIEKRFISADGLVSERTLKTWMEKIITEICDVKNTLEKIEKKYYV